MYLIKDITKARQEGFDAGLAQQFSDKEIFMHGWNAATEKMEVEVAKLIQEAKDQGYAAGVDAGNFQSGRKW